MDYTFKKFSKTIDCLRSIALVCIRWDRIVFSRDMHDLLLKILPIILQNSCADLDSYLKCGTSLFLRALFTLLFLCVFLKHSFGSIVQFLFHFPSTIEFKHSISVFLSDDPSKIYHVYFSTIILSSLILF